ncbi:MAG: hypothetical protein AAB686_02865 [Patescibacteria group bacterium]
MFGGQVISYGVNKIREIWNIRLPLPVVVLMLVVIGGGALWLIWNLNPVLEYQLYLPAGGGTAKLEFGSWPALQSPEFFDQVKKKLVDEESDFVEANLAEMKLTIYEKGSAVN